ncbi:hypothetical protein N9L24_02870, partial [Candidatus Marinamargulisbacteria bacterium]|nr:hypothetical protein [Candidatus Marinamargulisbacteria bacterium]
MIFPNLSATAKSSLTSTTNTNVQKINKRNEGLNTKDIIDAHERSHIGQQYTNDASNDRTGGDIRVCTKPCCGREVAQAHPAKDTPKAPAQQ